MNAREQGRQAARSVTTVLALAGFAFAGGMGVALYTGIEAAKAATVHVAGDDGSSASASDPPTTVSQQGDDGAPAQQTAPSSSGSSSSQSGLSAGSGPSQTSSSGS